MATHIHKYAYNIHANRNTALLMFYIHLLNQLKKKKKSKIQEE